MLLSRYGTARSGNDRDVIRGSFFIKLPQSFSQIESRLQILWGVGQSPTIKSIMPQAYILI